MPREGYPTKRMTSDFPEMDGETKRGEDGELAIGGPEVELRVCREYEGSERIRGVVNHAWQLRSEQE